MMKVADRGDRRPKYRVALAPSPASKTAKIDRLPHDGPEHLLAGVFSNGPEFEIS